VAKLIRRNPHVFADTTVAGIDEIVDNWEAIKKAEKARSSTMDGVVLGQPALALAAKVLHRAARGDLDVPLPTGDDFGSELLRLVARGRAEGVDAETALREAVLGYMARIREAEKE
jgi:XTP/dITP diphosphohydrolase